MKIAKLFLALAALVLASCSKEGGSGAASEAAEAPGMLSVDFPGKHMIKTYATFPDNSDENAVAINQMYIYIFDDATGVLRYTVKFKELDYTGLVARFPLDPADPTAVDQDGNLTGYIGQNVTVAFVANYQVPTAQFTVGTTTLAQFRQLVVPTIATTADIKPFIMYGEAGTTLMPFTQSTLASVLLTRLAARIDVTNEIGSDLEIVSAQVRNAATTSYLALPSPAAQPASYADLDLRTNQGLGTNGLAGTGAPTDDMEKMWAQIYTYPNTNASAADATTVDLVFKYKGVSKNSTVVFKNSAGATIPVERNYRYNIRLTQQTINTPYIGVDVMPWDSAFVVGGNMTRTALNVTPPAVDGQNIISYTPNVNPTTGNLIVVTGSSYSFDLLYSSTSPVSYTDTAPPDGSGGQWFTVAHTQITTYAAAGAYTGKITVTVTDNLDPAVRDATLDIHNLDRSVFFTIRQEQGVITPTVGSDANSFIVAPGSQPLIFDMTQVVNEGKGRIAAGDDIRVKLLWTDSPKGIAVDAPVSAISCHGTGTSARITVTPGTDDGNAVVAAYNHATGKIVWSWHIWVTTYDPSTTNDQYTSTGNKASNAPDAGTNNTFMDRNLGALNNTPGDTGSLGLLYQWGRKDPFPTSKVWTSNNEPGIYDETGTAIQINKVRSDMTPNAGNPDNLTYSVENPMTFLFGSGSGFNDWYTGTNVSANRNDNLWSTVTGTGAGTTVAKSVYDPCPKGWRVPAYGAFNGLSITNGNSYAFPWSNSKPGRFGNRSASMSNDFASPSHYPGVNATLGYFPATGYRLPNSGDITNVSNSGCYWLSFTAGDQVYMLFFFNANNDPLRATSRSGGYNVRCIKE
ncbi:MAG: hypothetical protein LBH06_08580 [Rikenellaceae bacterium]|jgi:hypothetical protein|nr:hypothetical protein [Rikenellaceae bacterium]